MSINPEKFVNEFLHQVINSSTSDMTLHIIKTITDDLKPDEIESICLYLYQHKNYTFDYVDKIIDCPKNIDKIMLIYNIKKLEYYLHIKLEEYISAAELEAYSHTSNNINFLSLVNLTSSLIDKK